MAEEKERTWVATGDGEAMEGEGERKRRGSEEAEERPAKCPKVSKGGKEDELPAVIFSRLPAHFVARGAAVSKRWQKILTGAEFWVQLYHHPIHDLHLAYLDRGCKIAPKFIEGIFDLGHGKHDFYLAGGHTSPIAHGLPFAGGDLSYRFIGCCNGLVAFQMKGLSDTFSLTCAVANPATSQQLTHVNFNFNVHDWIFAFGYDTSEDTYKMFIQHLTNFLVVPLRGAGGKPLTVISGVARTNGNDFGEYSYSLSIHGMCYVLQGPNGDDQGRNVQDSGGRDKWQPKKPRLLSFDVHSESVTSIEIPEHDMLLSGLMEIRDKVCVATCSVNRAEITLSVLTHNLQWERLCILESVAAGGRGGRLFGAWCCRERLVLWFQKHGLRMYDLSQRVDAGCARQPVQGCTLEGHEAEHQELLSGLHQRYQLCWGYRPTLIAPSRLLGVDGSGRVEDNVAPFLSAGRRVPEKPAMGLMEAVATVALKFLVF